MLIDLAIIKEQASETFGNNTVACYATEDAVQIVNLFY
jgi:hypothetical protein